jgi:GTPase
MTRKITELIREILDDWKREVIPENWKKIAQFSNLSNNIVNIVYLSAVAIHGLDTVVSYLNTDDDERRFLVDIHYSFNYLSSPNYEIIATMQIIQGVALCCMESLSKNLLIVCVRIISFRLYKNFIYLAFP